MGSTDLIPFDMAYYSSARLKMYVVLLQGLHWPLDFMLLDSNTSFVLLWFCSLFWQYQGLHMKENVKLQIKWWLSIFWKLWGFVLWALCKMAAIDILANYSIKELAGQSVGTMYSGLELITLHFPSIGRANGSLDDKLGSLPVISWAHAFHFFFFFPPDETPPRLFDESECPLMLVNKAMQSFCSLWGTWDYFWLHNWCCCIVL